MGVENVAHLLSLGKEHFEFEGEAGGDLMELVIATLEMLILYGPGVFGLLVK